MSEQPQDLSSDTGQAGAGQAPASDDVVDPKEQPAAGGTDDGEPAQGEGAPDSW